MNHLRVLCLTTSALFGGCVCGSFSNKLKHQFLRVSAQPTCPKDDDCPALDSSETNILDLSQSPLDGRDVQRGAAKGSPGVQGWIHEPGSCKWIEAIAKPGGLASQWLPYEKGGHVFPHYEVPTRVLLDYRDFLLCYDTETKTPIWVLEEITMKGLTTKPKSFQGFCRVDERLPEELQPLRRDYDDARERFKYLVLNYLDFHKHTADESYVLTGLAPRAVKNLGEHLSFDVWDEFFHYIYQLKVTYKYDDVFVLSGPLYLPKKDKKDCNTYRRYELIGDSKIGVPTHFFKVIVSTKDGHLRFECFKFENKISDKNYDLREFTVRREQLEKEAGFTVFKEIEDCQIKSKCMEPRYVKAAYSCVQQL